MRKVSVGKREEDRRERGRGGEKEREACHSKETSEATDGTYGLSVMLTPHWVLPGVSQRAHREGSAHMSWSPWRRTKGPQIYIVNRVVWKEGSQVCAMVCGHHSVLCPTEPLSINGVLGIPVNSTWTSWSQCWDEPRIPCMALAVSPICTPLCPALCL